MAGLLILSPACGNPFEPGPAAGAEPPDAALAKQPEADTATQRYAGRSLEEWQLRLKRIDPRDPSSRSDVPGMRALLRDADVPWYTRRQAALTLGRMGDYATGAVPDLIRILETEANPDDSEQVDRSWAIKALAIYGDVASAATEDLIRITNAPDSTFGERAACLEALSQIGVAHPDTLPTLLKVLRDVGSIPNLSETERRFMEMLAVEGLGVIGPGAAAAVPQLIQATRSDSSELRRLAATTLGRIGPASDVAIPALVDRVFDDESEAVRDAAALALPTCGPRATTALSLILQDEEASQRLRGAKAVGMYETLPDALQAPVRKLLDDPDPTVRVEAAGSLWKSTGDARAVLPVLLEALSESDRQVRLQAVRLFPQLGKAAESAKPQLQLLAEDERRDVRQAASKVLEQLASDTRGNE